MEYRFLALAMIGIVWGGVCATFRKHRRPWDALRAVQSVEPSLLRLKH